MNRKEVKRTFRVKVSFSFGEFSLIKQKARACGRTTARYIRDIALEKEIKLKQFSPEEKESFRAMVGIANNINQIARRYNQGDIVHVELLKTRESLQLLINSFIKDDR